jgi:hypothetical protein
MDDNYPILRKRKWITRKEAEKSFPANKEKKCPKCGYFLIDIISWDQPLEFCQKCQYEKEKGIYR